MRVHLPPLAKLKQDISAFTKASVPPANAK